MSINYLDDWDKLSQEVTKYLTQALRPSVDAAISQRERAGETNMAELDADSASRGMLGSTFVTSQKSREMQNVQSDIAGMESSYSATLASKLYDAMQKSSEMKQKQNQFDRQMNLEYSKLSHQYGGSGSGSSSGATKYGNKILTGGMSHKYEEYCSYLDRLGPDVTEFFYNTNPYWTGQRKQLLEEWGETGYMWLLEKYVGDGRDESGRNPDWRLNGEEAK